MPNDNITLITISDGDDGSVVLELDGRKVAAVFDNDGLVVPSRSIPEWVWREIRRRGLFYARDDMLDDGLAGRSATASRPLGAKGVSRRQKFLIAGVALIALAVVIASVAINALISGGTSADSLSYDNPFNLELSQEMAESTASVYADVYSSSLREGLDSEGADVTAQLYTGIYHWGREVYGFLHGSALVLADRSRHNMLEFESSSVENVVLAAVYTNVIDQGYSEQISDEIQIAVRVAMQESALEPGDLLTSPGALEMMQTQRLRLIVMRSASWDL